MGDLVESQIQYISMSDLQYVRKLIEGYQDSGVFS